MNANDRKAISKLTKSLLPEDQLRVTGIFDRRAVSQRIRITVICENRKPWKSVTVKGGMTSEYFIGFSRGFSSAESRMESIVKALQKLSFIKS